jgi:hypothetical protein
MVVSGSVIAARSAHDPWDGAATTVVTGRPSAHAIKKAMADPDVMRRFMPPSTIRSGKPDTMY